MDIHSLFIAFGLTLFAGLSTGIGSALAFFTKHTNTKFLSLALGFSAGVMIYVSFVEIFFKGKNILTSEDVFGQRMGTWITVLAFFGGMALIAIIDKLVPNVDNPHEVRKVEEIDESVLKNKKLQRMGLLTALAIAIHNFPEGLATFTAALSDPSLGIAIAVAIAIHNIPEGIAVSVPVYYATKSRKKAFWLSFSSGLAEPVGAIVGYLILMPFIKSSDTMMGIIFAAVAGIMVFISLDELLPAAEEYGEHHLSIYGLVTGMALMAVSLLLFI
ncbi:MAG: zinc transporter ZupT [Bacteroidales bacterium]|nr:zinc transporter ZupT [Bacteroidales bacterium]